MDMSLILKKAIEKLDSIENDFKLQKGYSNVLLFKEYIRRLSNIYVLSESKESFNVNFYLTFIEGKIEGLEEQVNTLMKSRNFRSFGNGSYVLIYSFLYWEVCKYLLPFELTSEQIELYKPLIRIFERGGYITREGRIFDICDMEGFSLSTLRSNDIPILGDLSDENLDKIDKLYYGWDHGKDLKI